MTQERSCIACKQKFKQSELLRIAKINETFILDEKHNMGGRGAYICKKHECIDLTIKKKNLNRAFKMNVGPSIYDILGEYGKNI